MRMCLRITYVHCGVARLQTWAGHVTRESFADGRVLANWRAMAATEAKLGDGGNVKSAEDLREDNKRLQEMLHAALRREAEALRRVKHLSELLAEYRVNGSRTPSSGPDRMLWTLL